jgi:hypothetical protein
MSRRNAICIIMVLAMLVSLLTGFTPGTLTAQAEENLVLHLKFDSDLTDSSGQGNDAECTYGSIKYTDGIFGKAAYFNGKSYIEIKDNPTLDLDRFTISFWANKAVRMKGDTIVPYIYKEEDGDVWAPPYQIFEFGDNQPLVWLHDMSDGTEMDQFYMNCDSIDIRKWFLMTVTYDGDEVRMYENDVLIKKQSVTGSPADTSGNLYIGMKDGKYYFNGEMDDFRIYNYGLSSQEVSALYEKGLTGANNPEDLKHTDKLVAHYRFEDNYKDSSKWGNDGKLATGKVTFVDGVNGKAAKFAKGSYLEVHDNEILDCDQGFTITSWIYKNKDSDLATLIYKNGVSTSYNSDDFAYRVHVADDYYDFDYVPFGLQTGELKSRYTPDQPANKWFHLAVTFDTEEIRWYINGKLVVKEEVSENAGSKLAHSVGDLMIGSDGNYHFIGSIDELKIFNYALSASQVEAEAKKIDSLSISDANQKSIKAMKVNSTVTLVPSRKYIETGKTSKLTSGVSYKSSNNKVLTVSSKGVIKAVKKGTATLTITHGGISKSYKVTVK